MFKRVFCLLLSALIFLSVCGCKNDDKKSVKYDVDAPIDNEATQTIASNSDYDLLWDETNFCIMIKCRSTGKIWSNIPYEYLMKQGTSNAVNSTVNITIMNKSSMKWDDLRGYNEVVSNGRISVKKIENGIKITYYFDKCKIAVPVEYTLRSDSLEAVIKTSEIIEGGEYSLASISLNPYFTSSANNNDSYLFVPTGSGALMFTDERAEKTREYKGTVYGEDASRIVPEIINDPEQIYLPVFGSVQKGNEALLGIIENGAESAVIEAEAGNSRTGYSTVYPTLYVRGYDAYPTNLHSWSYKDLKYLAKDISNVDIKIGYYPLNGKEANYNGMAMRYRKFLTDNKLLNEAESENGIYSVSLLGGLLKNVSTFGIPREKTAVLTSFKQAKTIISDISENAGITPSVQMVGYGNNGADIGKIAGGFGFIKEFGNNADRLELEKLCKEQKIDLFTDFDLLRFSESGSGFSYLRDSAKSATLHIAESYYINNPLRDYDEDHIFRFLKRTQISKAVDKLIKFADKKNVSGLSLSTLGSLAYSDYSDIKYSVKGNTEVDAVSYLSKIQNSGHKMAVSNANGFAAAIADTVFGVPLTNGDYDTFDQWIPFYQMVFSGTKPIYSEYLNTVENSRQQILRAVASGTGLGFALSYNYDIEAAINSTFPSYGVSYENNKEFILSTLNEYGEHINRIHNLQLQAYEIFDNGLSISSFSGGVKVYVNHSDKTIDSPIGSMSAFTVKISEN